MRYLFIFLIALSPAFGWVEPEEVFVDEIDESEYDRGESYARFTYADKYVFVTHEDDEEEQVIRNLPAASGDFLKTRTASYAEVEFIDGSLLQVADRTHVEFQAINEIYNNESLSVFKLYKGSLFLHVTDEWDHSDRRVFRVDTEDGSTYIEAPGIYRVDRENGLTKLKVFRGFAELSGERHSEPVYSGEYSQVRNMGTPSRTRTFNSFYGDRFERWAYERRPRSGSVSSAYVDGSISSYAGDLDDHGEWRYHDELDTHVWVPVVTTSWRPYYHGYWVPRHGRLTWVSYDPFGWVTHHYGRWGWSIGFGWHWIPGYRYSPAWVAWSSFDTYLGWCPLGYWNRPYYYWRHRPSTVIINHHHYRWRYISATRIIHRERIYSDRGIIHRGKRHISTGRIALDRRGSRSAVSLTRAARNPAFNREVAATRTYRRGTLATRTPSGRIERTAIRGPRTGTSTVIRHSPRITRSISSRGGTSVSTDRAGRSGSSREVGVTRGSSTRNSSVTRGSTSRSGTSRSSVTRDRGSSSRSNATRGSSSRGSSSRSNATRGSSGSSSRSNATRGSSGSSSRSNATRGSSSRGNRENATRGSSGSSSRSNATRGSSSRGSSSRSNATRGSGSSSRSNATRGSSSRGSSSRSNATRSSGSSSRSNATRSSGSSSRSKATRSSGSKSSRSNATRSSGSSSRSSATRSSGSKPRSSSASRGSSSRKRNN